MSTIFSKIISGEIPSYKIAEDDDFYAFLDIQPIAKGHVLVVPKSETDKLFDLDEHYLSRLLVFAKPIAKAIEATIPCKRCGITVIGLEVPHAHMHLVPMQSADDVNFTRPKLSCTSEELQIIRDAIVLQLSHSG